MTNLKLFLLSISSALVQVVCWESKLISVDLDPPWIFPAGALCPSFFFFFFFTSLSPSLPRHFPLSFPRTTRVTWVCHHFFFFYLPPGTYIEMAVFAQVEYTTKG